MNDLQIFCSHYFPCFGIMEAMLKKLIYRSHYRGTKEGDFLLSSFAKDMLDTCSVDEVNMYDELLNHRDAEIHQWTLFPERAPLHLQSILMKIADFHRFSGKG